MITLGWYCKFWSRMITFEDPTPHSFDDVVLLRRRWARIPHWSSAAFGCLGASTSSRRAVLPGLRLVLDVRGYPGCATRNKCKNAEWQSKVAVPGTHVKTVVAWYCCFDPPRGWKRTTSQDCLFAGWQDDLRMRLRATYTGSAFKLPKESTRHATPGPSTPSLAVWRGLLGAQLYRVASEKTEEK